MIFDLGLVRDARLLHGRGLRGLRRRARRAARRRRALRRPARALRPRRCPPCGWALNVERLHIALVGRGARRAMSAERPHASPSRAGRCCGETLDLLDALGVDTAEVRSNDRKLLFEDVGHRHDAARPTCRPTSRPAPPTSASPARTCSPSRPSATSTSCSTSASGVHDGVRDRRGRRSRRPRRCAGSGVMRIATKYPRIAARYFERTGRQAEIVEVKGSVELAPLTGLVEGDRRPHRDRHDAARERARRARGDRRLDRAPDRQPGRPQAQGRRDRRAPGARSRAA